YLRREVLAKARGGDDLIVDGSILGIVELVSRVEGVDVEQVGGIPLDLDLEGVAFERKLARTRLGQRVHPFLPLGVNFNLAGTLYAKIYVSQKVCIGVAKFFFLR